MTGLIVEEEFKFMRSLLRPLLVIFGLLTLVTGFVYPWVAAGIGALAFPEQVRAAS